MTNIDKVLELAQAQVGITESPKNSNNVKYNTWYYGHAVSGSAFPWCAAFMQWLFHHAGYPLPYKTASCAALLNWYKSHDPKRVISGSGTAKRGDVIIFNFGHTGVVVKDNGSTITTIEGNTASDNKGDQANGGGVFKRTRSKSLVTAFLRVLDEKEVEAGDSANTATAAEPKEVNYTVKVTASSLNCRTGPNSATIIRAFSKDTVLKISKEQDGWGYCGEGWVCLEYTIKVEEEEEMTQERFNELMTNYLKELASQEPSNWSAEDREWAESNGLVGGDEKGNKMYKKFVTREEMVALLHRLTNALGK